MWIEYELNYKNSVAKGFFDSSKLIRVIIKETLGMIDKELFFLFFDDLYFNEIQDSPENIYTIYDGFLRALQGECVNLGELGYINAIVPDIGTLPYI